MEKDKSRGQKHVKNKQKYKGNSIKKVEHVPAKFAPVLDSNWDRYEDINEESFTIHERKDFSTLATAPIGHGKHFQFKGDKALAEEVERNKNLFQLNLKTLQENILTIPFYDRLNIPKHIFSEQQILIMDTEAIENSKKVEMKYKQIFNNESKKNIEEKVGENQIIGDIDFSSDSKAIQPETPKKHENSNDDLESWLDAILDD